MCGSCNAPLIAPAFHCFPLLSAFFAKRKAVLSAFHSKSVESTESKKQMPGQDVELIKIACKNQSIDEEKVFPVSAAVTSLRPTKERNT